METFADTYFKREQSARDNFGNVKKYADNHRYDTVVELANAIAVYKNSLHQQCAKVMIDQARRIKSLEEDNISYINSDTERYMADQRFDEQLRTQLGGY